MADVKIGCTTMIRHNEKIMCNKGRGVIMPGGKWVPGETFVDTARRELLVFHGMSEEGYAFSAEITTFAPKDSDEGDVVLTDWHTLLQSKFKGSYRLMKMEIECSLAK